MQWIYPRSRERELAWKIGAAALGGSLLLSPFAMLALEHKDVWSARVVRREDVFILFFSYECLFADIPHQWIWDFSQILESVCVLPQLLLLRQTTVPTVINSFYLLALGSYRALYLVGWITRELDMSDRSPNPVSVIFGIIQTALYIDFAWVYYSRQRVKLRNGGIVDADDLRRGWFLHRILGKRADSQSDDDEESAPALGRESGRTSRPKWGSRGISVSADEGVLDVERDARGQDEGIVDAVDPDARMKDPDELARALEDDDDAPGPSTSVAGASSPNQNGISSGQEWRDN